MIHFVGVRDSERGGIIFRLLLLACFLSLLFAIYLVRHPLLRLAGNFWIIDDSPAYADAIVILGDDNYNGDRAARAASLFKAGWAPRVVASGRYLRPYASIAELEQHDLEGDGVPKDAIVRFEHRARDTHEEAIALRQLISSKGWKRIIVVTSTYHTRRSRYICSRLFPPGTLLRVVPASDGEYDPNNWWTTRAGFEIFGHELAGMVVTLWEMRHDDVQTRDSALLTRLLRGMENPYQIGTVAVYRVNLPVI